MECVMCKNLNDWISNREENWNMNRWEKLFSFCNKKIEINDNVLFDQVVNLKKN